MRGRIIEAIKRNEKAHHTTGVPTWWLKFDLDMPTYKIRIELIKMEKDGIVEADRMQINNTLWTLKKDKK